MYASERRFVIAFYSLIAFPMFGFADTSVSGIIDADTTWTRAASPYVVIDNIIVNQGKTLFIEPGVIINFEMGKSLRIDGALIARGTALENITFTSNSNPKNKGDWGYILFSGTSTGPTFDTNGDYASGSILEFCNVEYGGSNASYPDTGLLRYKNSFFLKDCSIEKSSTCAIFTNFGAVNESKILGNIIFDNELGGIFTHSVSNLSVRGNLFIENNKNHIFSVTSYSGIYIGSGSNIDIRNNLFINNYNGMGHSGGLEFNSLGGTGIAALNIFVGNSSGGSGNSSGSITVGVINPTALQIMNNTIIAVPDSRPEVSWGSENANIAFRNNNLFNNSLDYSFRMFYFPNPREAINNWWGTTNEGIIKAKIFDGFDDVTLGIVNYSPFLAAPDTDAPISPPTVTNNEAIAGNVKITWTANPESDTKGYKVYWDPLTSYSFANSIDVGNVTSFTLTGASLSAAIAVTAYDNDYISAVDNPATVINENQISGHESWYSSAVGPQFATPPASQSIRSGNTTTLTVTVTGTAPFHYQWYAGAKGTTTTPVGADSNSFTTPPIAVSAEYWVRVTNTAGSADSDSAVIVTSPRIITQPGSKTISKGQTATLSVAATGSPTLQFQWFLGISGDTSSPVGADSTNYVTAPLFGNASFWIRVTNENGQDDSMTAIINILTPQIQLSHMNLTFGCKVNEATSAQTVVISAIGGGILNWTAFASDPWISINPSSGTGNAILAAAVITTGKPVGKYTGTISISDPNASGSPKLINVLMNIIDPALSSIPFGWFDSPPDGGTGITGAIPVTGWALDDIEVAKVELWRDPVISAGEVNSRYFVGNAIFVEGARPDIETLYPEYPFNYRGGWGYMLLTNFLPNNGNGTYVLYAVAHDTDGHTIELGSKTITCDNTNSVKPFGTIDTPAQGGSYGGSFFNFGWVLSPWPGTVPKDGHSITVFVDSVPRGNLSTPPNLYNAYRSDVSENFPGLKNTDGPVGAFLLDTSGFANGLHTIFWIVFDDMNRWEGIGSRYFSILNTGAIPEAGGGGATGSIDQPLLGFLLSAEKLSLMPESFAPVSVSRGFNLNASNEIAIPDVTGDYRFEIAGVELLQVDLGFLNGPGSRAEAVSGSAIYIGFEIVNNELRSLPIGSRLDHRTGQFSWMPGPGFLGEYRLVFIKDLQGIQTVSNVLVKIRPKI